MQVKLLIFLIISVFVGIAICHTGRQFTIWKPERTTPSDVPMVSFRPCKIEADKPDFSMLYDEFFFAPAISNPQSYEVFAKSKIHSPSYVNRQLYTKLSHLWKNMERERALPPNQCYTTYIDVNSASGDIIVGLRSRGFDADPTVNTRDVFTGFRRYASTNSQSTGAAVMGFMEPGMKNYTLNITEEVVSTNCDLAGGAANCPAAIVTNYRVAVEVCNKTTIEFVPVAPLGSDRDALAQTNKYTRFAHTFDVDLRGTFDNHKEINIGIFNGQGATEFFAITAKAIPTKFSVPETQDTRNIYSVVLDGNNLNPSTWSANWASNSGGQFENNASECGPKLNYDAKSPSVSQTEDFLELFCLKLPENTFQKDTDYLIDFGLFAEPSPATRNKFHSVAIGLKSEDRFIGFNRRGFMNNKLGDVFTASVNSRGLFDLEERYSVLQNKPIDGSILRSMTTASFFNVKISVYGKDCPGEQPGVSVFAGTPDCPPYSFVWDTLGQVPFNWTAEDVSVCVYQQSKIRESDCIDLDDDEWVNAFLPQSTNIYGLSASVEQADFGCDGIDLSQIRTDRCGVCGGSDECVGCDDKPHSGLVNDGCGVCNGTNTTCCTQVCGVDDHLWDWLLVPHIIDDVVERFTMLSEELDNTCKLLGRYSDLCDKDPSVANAFASVDLGNHISENLKWRRTCLSSLSDCVTAMSRNITNYVPIAF